LMIAPAGEPAGPKLGGSCGQGRIYGSRGLRPPDPRGQAPPDTSLTALGTQLACRGSGGYDCNGDVLTNGTFQYAYDQENRLVGVSNPGAGLTETLSYDPLGRLKQTVVAAGAATQFLYDGEALVGEYDGTGALLRRYIHGPGVDEPLASYESGVLGWLHADRQGSIVARSNAAGSINATYAYGSYGEPQTWGGTRFAYTGQIELPEAQLYYYKARVYDSRRIENGACIDRGARRRGRTSLRRVRQLGRPPFSDLHQAPSGPLHRLSEEMSDQSAIGQL
jgi:YD repeat-containing protein